jgi:hypothetical protein
MKCELGLEVGLLKIGEHPPGIGRLVLRVEVALAVGRIEEPVHAFAGCAVERGPGDSDLVLGLEVVQPDAGGVDDVGKGQPFSVEEYAVDIAADEVQERGGPGLTGREVNDAAARVPGDPRIRRLSDVEGDIVAVGFDQG